MHAFGVTEDAMYMEYKESGYFLLEFKLTLSLAHSSSAKLRNSLANSFTTGKEQFHIFCMHRYR